LLRQRDERGQAGDRQAGQGGGQEHDRGGHRGGGGEPRVRAAVLGLAGSPGLAGTAARITVPVQFLVQWDDERIPRDRSLAVFGALGSAEKTLHANPGKHGDLPSFETGSALRFFARHLN